MAEKYFISDRLSAALLLRSGFKNPLLSQKYGDHLLTQIAAIRIYRAAMCSQDRQAALAESFEPGNVADFRVLLLAAEFYDSHRGPSDPPGFHNPSTGLFEDE